MSQQNVEIVLDVLRLFEAEDFDSASEYWHADSRITAPVGWPEQGPFVGLDAIIEQFRRIAVDFGEHRFRDLKVVADREGWVVLSYLWNVRGAESQAPIASKMAAAYHVTDGKIKEAHFRWSSEEAREAAGLAG